MLFLKRLQNALSGSLSLGPSETPKSAEWVLGSIEPPTSRLSGVSKIA